MAERNKNTAQTKKYRTSAPKGVRLADGYTDRAREREAAADEREERLKALEESLKNEEIDQETYDKLRYQIAGGDLSSTHLVKGLDFKLLERVRKGEDVYSATKQEEEEAPEEEAEEAGEVDVDDELDQLAQKEVQAVEKEKTAKKKGQLSTVSAAAGKKRTRDQILAEFKAARQAAKEKAEAEAALGGRFKKIGEKQKPGTRIERDNKGREVLIIVDEDGHEKRKVRKIQPGNAPDSSEDNGLLMPDKDAKPLGMEVPEQYKQKEPVDEEDDDDIFAGAGDDYDPLAGMDDSGSDSEGEAKEGKEAEPKSPASSAMPPPPRPKMAQNYFKDSKTGLISEETTQSPSMSDPAIMAAIKRAAALRPLGKGEDDEDDEDLDEKAKEERAKAKAAEERRKKMLQNVDRDAEDMDMGFGTSRYEDEADFDESDIKLSRWNGGGGEDDDEGEGGGKGKKKRVRTKKRKGDVNSAADVLRVMEERKK